MKTKNGLLILMFLMTLSVSLFAQDKESERQAKKEYYKQFSRWSLGVNAGLPFTYGDMTSFAEEKTYMGVIGGLQLTYQLSPTFGLSLTGEYGDNKAGHKAYETDFILAPNGWIHPGPISTAPAGSEYFKNLYTRERYFLGGLHFDINLWNLFAGQRQNPGRFTIIASPGIYLQKFDPQVNLLSNDNQFASKFDGKLGLGVGGNLSFRYRASKVVDLQLKTNMQWVSNRLFDGIANTAEHELASPKYQWAASAMVGVIFKFGGKSKKENLMWATNRWTRPAAAPAPAPEPVKEVAPAPVVAPAPEPAKIVEKVVVPDLPSVHFKRDKSVIDRTKYKSQLEEILSVVKQYSDKKITIKGFADKTGNKIINDNISKARAEALKKYLIENGVDASRIISAEGYGVDTSLDEVAIFGEKARRAEAKIILE